VFSAFGSSASAPIAVVGIWSVLGSQVTPPSVVRQTPLSAPPTKKRFAFVGLHTIAEIRPA
jgi:hypothetical protein